MADAYIDIDEMYPCYSIRPRPTTGPLKDIDYNCNVHGTKLKRWMQVQKDFDAMQKELKVLYEEQQ